MGLGKRQRSWLSAVMLASLAVAICAPARADSAKRYDDHKVIRIDLKTQADLDAVRRSGAVILDCWPGLKPTQVVASPDQLRQLERLGRRIEVLHDNAQAIVDADKQVVPRRDPFTDFFLDYHPIGDAATSGTIVWYMDQLASMNPGLVTMLDIGSTLESRTMWALRITNDMVPDKPGVIYFCDLHAREWITPTACLYFSNYLMENYGTDPLVTDLVDNVEIFIIPVVNVDGYVYSWTTDRWWRKNRRNNGGGSWGVDLNRNWGFAWGWDDIGSSPFPSDATYRGTGPFSEPETQALRDLFIAHPNVRAMLDMHAYGELILWPWGYIPDPTPDHDVYEEMGYAMQSLIYDVHGRVYAAGPGEIYSTNGGSADWTYGDQGVLSFAYELRPVGSPWFELPPDQIIPNNEEITPANLYLTNSDWVRAAMRYRFPGGLPGNLAAGSDTTIAVDIIDQAEAAMPGTARLYYRFESGDPYAPVPLTLLGGHSYEVIMPAANCASTPEYYFSVTGDGGTTVTSPRNAPAEGVYTALVVTGESSFFLEDLSTHPGWTTEGQWACGPPTGGGGEYGGPDPTTGHTGSNVCGYNLSGDYPNYLPETHLTSTAVDCTGQHGVHLKFWRWLNVETPAYDHAYVRVSNNGTDWVTVWANTTEVTDSSWTLQEIDISAVADDQPTVYLRWTMGPTDSGWRYSGWNIDDIELTAALCEDAFAPPVADGIPKNRYVCFTAGLSAGMPQAFRVTTVSNPLFPETVGWQKWVSPPDADNRARLQCNPAYLDWGFDLIDVGDEDLVPGALYLVEATLNEVDFLSVPVTTAPVWGDLVGDFVDGEWTPPNNVVDFIDISAMVEGFRHLQTAPAYTRCDVYPVYPDGVVDFNDISHVVEAFRSDPYPFEAPTACE